MNAFDITVKMPSVFMTSSLVPRLSVCFTPESLVPFLT